jgi:antitoxin FitA
MNPLIVGRLSRAHSAPPGMRWYTPKLHVLHPIHYHSSRVKTIQIRNVPDDVHRVLRTRATAAGLSLSDYALQELERVAEHPPVADVLARARGRAGGTRSEAVVAAVRFGRDRS